MKRYGLIGFPLGHSFSKKYFEEKFQAENISDSEFINYSIENIEQVKNILNDTALQGFCITIPHKKNIIPYLHHASEAVINMQACNCVHLHDGRLYGYNTDVTGFEKSFIPLLKPLHNKALVLGTGGAAAAVAYVLDQLLIPYKFVSRNKVAGHYTYTDIDEQVMNDYPVIINCSPVGTYPHIHAAPMLPYQFVTAQHYLYDLIYNPAKTKFLSLGESQGAVIKNGYDMLTIQAEENWRIWNS